MKIIENHLIELGFTKVDVSAEESGDNPYYYYTIDLSEQNPNIALISCASDGLVDGEWTVEFWESEIRFHYFEHLRDIIFAVKNSKDIIEKEKKYSPKKNNPTEGSV